MTLTVLLPQSTVPASAASGERSLYLHHTHRDETVTITFWRNGKFDSEGLKKLNYFLRDWRTNDVKQMDPQLFSLLWEVYQTVRASQPINVVSSYRSPATNKMLRSKSSAVAENSQHMQGKAMDFYIPGIDLSTLRATAMRLQVGGVGYYPTSGSPFVHIDTANVRAWPRMTKAQLKKVFPDGKTLHLPTDGVPLSQQGRAYAENQWKQCHMVPCGVIDGSDGGSVMLASIDADAPVPAQRKTLADMLFGNDQGQDASPMQVADVGPASLEVQSIEVTDAPIPLMRPVSLGGVEMMTASLEPEAIPFSTTGSAPLDPADMSSDPNIPYPLVKSHSMMLATRDPMIGDGQTAVLAIAALDAPMPTARTLMSPVDDLVTSYAAVEPDPGAQRALQMIIERETTAALPDAAVVSPTPKPQLIGVSALRTASIGNTVGINALSDLFDATFSAVANAGAGEPVAAAVEDLASDQPLPGIEIREVDFVMPDIDHVAEIFAQPIAMSSAGYAVIFEHDEADFDPSTQLGGLVTRIGFETDPTTALSSTEFETRPPLLIAAR